MSLYAHLAVSCIGTSDQFSVCLHWICTWKEALIKDQFGNGQTNRVIGLCPDFWVIHVCRVLIYTDGQFLPDKRIATYLPLEEVRVVADFTELHDQVHQIFHLLLVLFKLEQVTRADLVLDPLVKDPLPIRHLAE